MTQIRVPDLGFYDILYSMIYDFSHKISGFTIADNECWEWPTINKQLGYGLMSYGHTGKEYAHRVFYHLFKGELEKGMTIDHLCRNRRCVNPDHLEQVTSEENKRRGFSGAAINARKETCPYNHFSYKLKYNGKRECTECKKRHSRDYYLKRKPINA